jgi:hypothetical protein
MGCWSLVRQQIQYKPFGITKLFWLMSFGLLKEIIPDRVNPKLLSNKISSFLNGFQLSFAK